MVADPRLIPVGILAGCEVGVVGATEGEKLTVEDGRRVAVEHVEPLVEQDGFPAGGDDDGGGV